MNKIVKLVGAIAVALASHSLFAYNYSYDGKDYSGYENSLDYLAYPGVGYANNKLTARVESGTTIAANKYAQCSKLTSVSLANVTSIGNAAFAYSALTSVELPSTLKSMGYIAFGGCKNLSSVTINSTAFMSSANEAKEPFRDCTALKTVTAKCAPPSWDFKKVFPSVTTVKVPQANLTAWQAKKYAGVTVEDLSSFAIFDGNGGTVSGKASVKSPLTAGTMFGKQPTAVLSGKVFVGWFTAKAGGKQVNCSSIVPEGTTTYYAHYEDRLSLGKAFVGSNISASWESNGWCGQATVTHDGVAAARSGYITNNGRSYLQTTVTGEGTLTFWWKTSCESASNDALRFLVDGTEKKVLSGERDWAQATIIIHGSGTHTIKWNYTKNATVSKGEDYAWLDQVVWTPVSKAQSLSVSPDIGGAETLQSSGTSLSAMPDSVIRRGVLADGTGVYSLILDAADDMTGVIYIEFSDGSTLVEDCWLLENGVPMRVMTESMLVFEL